jgi:hypothetical protein
LEGHFPLGVEDEGVDDAVAMLVAIDVLAGGVADHVVVEVDDV